MVATEAGAAMTLMDGGMVWGASEEVGWIRGKIVKVVGTRVQIQSIARPFADEKAGLVYAMTLDDLLPVSELDDDANAYGDVLNLQVLHDAAVFETLRLRYYNDRIYTQAGPTSLISINPYKQIMPLYTQRAINTYKDNTDGAGPHVFGMAQNAYNSLIDNGICQSILCSGESGAGKTEVAKLVVQFLAATTSKDSTFKGGGKKVNPLFQTRQVQNQIIESNPLLEAFGNAKTVRNENSSRFGKFIQILFSPDHTICGGRVRHYLLEKARVVSQHEGERNYHVFYHLCAGMSAELKARLNLSSPHNFHYLNQSGVYELLDTDGKPMCDEMQEFSRTQQSMTQMRLDAETQDQVWEILAGILHLGNVAFETVANKNAADGSKLAATSQATMEIVAGLFKWDYHTLCKGLTCSLVKVTGEAQPIEVPQSTETCIHARDALSKVVYEKLFAWLVGCINECLQASDALANTTEAEKKKIEAHFIGVLDIFGFEVFENNSFEQLCINYANESLQQQFINQMLHAMMAQYESEGVKVDAIPFEDNSPCVDLLESKLGIFSMLDDECNFPKGSDDTFLGKLMDAHKTHSHLKPGGSSCDPHLKDIQTPASKTTIGTVRGRMLTIGEAFVVSHFAGEVEYNVRSFLEKNRDTINESLKTILTSSEHPLMKKLLEARTDDDAPAPTKAGRMIGGRLVGASTGARTVGARGGSRSVAQRKEDKRSLGSQFKMQLSELVGLIESGRAHYVRCIKPNTLRRAHCFEAPSVIRQLRCSGVTETVRARRAGWPVSHTFQDFVNRYKEVYISLSKRKTVLRVDMMPKTAGDDMMAILSFFLSSEQEWRIGTSKLFLRDQSSSVLEDKYKMYRLNCKLLLQARVRGVLQCSKYRKWAGASLSIQKNVRMWSAMMRRKRTVKAMRMLQHMARAKVACILFRASCCAAQELQAAARCCKRRRVHVAATVGACGLKAAVRRATKSALYSHHLIKLIEKEREGRRLQEEEEKRKRLADEERSRATLMAQEKYKIEAQADELCDEVAQSVDAMQLSMAKEQLQLAADCYKQAGRTDKMQLIATLERSIAKAQEREVSRQQGQVEMTQAEALLATGDSAGAKAAVQSAKANFERALASDMSDQVDKIMLRVQQQDDKAFYLSDAKAAEQQASALVEQERYTEASKALEKAKVSYKRAGSGAGGSSLVHLETQITAGEAAVEHLQAAKNREQEDLKKTSEQEQKAAEDQAKAMDLEAKQADREARDKAKEKDQQVQQAMDSQMAVAVGGYGHERPGSIGGAADLRDLALDHALSPSADRSAGKQGVARDAVSLEPDLPLQVLKEGWLLKQSKKLKKWQKRYFVLDNVALYYCRSPTSVPDGFFAIRRCQFHYSEKTCCFDVITPSRVFRMQTPDGLLQLREWADCYKKAMGARDFPYFHVEQTTRLDLSRELLLGVMSTGLRMVKLGLYDPGFEEEIAFYTFDEIYSWGASDLQTFEFRVASERMPYSFKTMHAQEIESKLEAKFTRWRDWRLYQQQIQQSQGAAPASAPRVTGAHRGRFASGGDADA